MYSTVGLLKNSKKSGKLIGTHQKLDRVARAVLPRAAKTAGVQLTFPGYREIVYFEGSRGPDGLKRKSPGEDEPMHFILPDDDNGKLWGYIENHLCNLREALLEMQNSKRSGRKKSRAQIISTSGQPEVRAAFEAAWLAHTITDGLTPAHHFPYEQAVKELMSDKEYVTIFGQPIKGIMRGDTLAETVANNRKYWGVEGYMTKHIAYEYDVALLATRSSLKTLTPRISLAELKPLLAEDFVEAYKKVFYESLHKVNSYKMYDKFRQDGWTLELRRLTRDVLLPEIVKNIVLAWFACVPKGNLKSGKEKK